MKRQPELDDFLALLSCLLIGSIPESRWKETPLAIKMLVIIFYTLSVGFVLVILGAWFYNSLLR